MTDDTSRLTEASEAILRIEARGESQPYPATTVIALARGYLDLRRRLAEAEQQAERLAEAARLYESAAGWYCACLNDLRRGVPVRGLDEARAAYETYREKLGVVLAEAAGEETSDG